MYKTVTKLNSNCCITILGTAVLCAQALGREVEYKGLEKKKSFNHHNHFGQNRINVMRPHSVIPFLKKWWQSKWCRRKMADLSMSENRIVIFSIKFFSVELFYLVQSAKI